MVLFKGGFGFVLFIIFFGYIVGVFVVVNVFGDVVVLDS